MRRKLRTGWAVTAALGAALCGPAAAQAPSDSPTGQLVPVGGGQGFQGGGVSDMPFALQGAATGPQGQGQSLASQGVFPEGPLSASLTRDIQGEASLDQARQLLLQASRATGSARGQAQEQALSALQGLAGQGGATGSFARDAIRNSSLQAGIKKQGEMGTEVEPLLSQKFKSQLKGKIGGKICGIASLAMLALHMGKKETWTAQDTKKYVEGPEAIYVLNKGTDHQKLAQAATKLGIPSTFQESASPSAIKAQLDRGKPMILLMRGNLAHIGTDGNGGFQPGAGGKSWQGHFVLAVGYTTADRQTAAEKAASGGATIFRINDPDRGIRVVVTERALSSSARGMVVSQ